MSRLEVLAAAGRQAGDPWVLSVPQAAARLGICPALAYGLVARGELPSLRFGRRVVVPTLPLLDLVCGRSADSAGGAAPIDGDGAGPDG